MGSAMQQNSMSEKAPRTRINQVFITLSQPDVNLFLVGATFLAKDKTECGYCYKTFKDLAICHAI